MARKKYPIGIQTFEKLIEGGYHYVDKTALIYDLVNTGTCYFLSRPRRFGKSLLISTLEAYFSGKKELFKGLAIEQLEHEWKTYPVLHLDLSSANYSEPGRLTDLLSSIIKRWEREYHCEPSDAPPEVRFGEIIEWLYEQTGKKVVILVDEYDAPLVNLIDKPELLEANRDTLSAFYKNIKSNDRYIEFAFLTGVTKFGHLSVFSALNNLEDISLDENYATICGISEQELHTNFDEDVEEMAQANKMTKEQCYDKLKLMYDGYHFCEDATGMYNPFSVLSALKSKRFGYYWFATGTPTALILALRDTHADVASLPGRRIAIDMLSNVNSYQEDITALLYQSGYLTITGSSPTGSVVVDFPNDEVRQGFLKQVVPQYTKFNALASSTLIDDFRAALLEGDVEAFIDEMKAFIAGIDYQFFSNTEQAFHFVFMIVCSLMRSDYITVESERRTNRGRMDMVFTTPKYIYVFEFKLDKSADEALAQIHERGYAERYATDPRTQFLVGVNFSTTERNIDDWRCETKNDD